MRDKAGSRKEGRQEVADIFAEFYGSLYTARSGGLQEEPWLRDDGRGADALTIQEIRKELMKEIIENSKKKEKKEKTENIY